MTEKEKEMVKNYPEAAAFAGIAESVWNGSNSPAKVEMLVKGKLFTAHFLENARRRCLVLISHLGCADPLELTPETTLGGYSNYHL